MRSCEHKAGVTLVEMLIVVSVIALLAAMVISTASRIDSQSKEQLTENTLALLNAALGQFRDYGYRYEDPDYYGFDFPLDCNDFDKSELESALAGDISGAHDDPNYSGSEVLYFFLSRVPSSRKTLEGIDRSLITNKGSDKQDMKITIDSREYPLCRVIDPWGETLRYSYYENEYENSNEPDIGERRNFPLITSAGPDREFGTADDIKSR